MKTVNLFGETVEVIPKINRSQSSYQRFKILNHYGKVIGGFKRCKTCDHHRVFEYHDKYYHKCELLGISNSEATDIRVSYVCDKWKEVKE